MKRILSNYWLVLFIAVLIAWPAVVISMQRVKPIDEATLDKLESLLEEKLNMSNKTIAPPPPKWDMEKKGVFMRDNLFNELLPIVAGDALSAKLEAAEEVYAPFIQYHDSLSSGTISQDYTHLLERQIAAKIQRASAQHAILTKDWDEALRRLYSAANMGNSCREQSLIGMLVATATRAIAYHGYNQLLHAGAPIEVKRTALEQLIRLRDTEPNFNENVVFSETLFSLKSRREMLENPELVKQQLGENQAAPVLPTQTIMMGVVSGLTVLDNELYVRKWSQLLLGPPPTKAVTDPALKRWINKRAMDNSFSGRDQNMFYKWTDIPAAQRWLKDLIEKEPWTYKTFGFSEDTYKNLDPWTLMLFGNLNYLSANLEEASSRCRRTSTQGRLLEAAFAAQIYQSEKGYWPNVENIKGMIPKLPEEVYIPIQISHKRAYGDLRSALWASVLPNMQGTWLNPKQGQSQYWEASFRGQTDEGKQKAAEALALKQILNQYPRLVESASLYQIDPLNSLVRKEINSVEDYQIIQPPTAPVSPTPTPTPTPTPRYGGYGYGGYGGYGYGSPQRPVPTVELLFSATLRAPESVWILWSPGPDGKDDGGTIQYDPSNGTISQGDLIVFPEEF